MKNSFRLFLIIILFACAVSVFSPFPSFANTSQFITNKTEAYDPIIIRSISFLSQPYKIDKIYKSMEGPAGTQQISLLDSNPPELLWIISYRVQVIGADGHSPVSQEFMCHNNLDFNAIAHGKLLGWEKITTTRMFTLSQGQFSIDFPKGFGVPVMSNEVFSLSTQVLNHNRKKINLDVRHKVTLDYIREQDLKEPMKALFPASGFVMAPTDGRDGLWDVDQPNETQKHVTCLPGTPAPKAIIYKDQFDRKFSGHWVVPPGRQEQHSLVTKLLSIPYDTTVHFIAVHVHPFCESLELKDLTSGQTVFKSTMHAPQEGIGLEHVDHFSSEKGIPIYKDHDYEMISIYNNTSGVNQDSMATFFLYLLDKDFQKPVVMTKN